MPITATLQEILLTADTRPRVIDDCCALIEHEVSGMSGISGTAVKLGYKTVNAFAAGHVRYLVGEMLPDIVARLEPYWADFGAASGGTGFGGYLAGRGDEVAQDLLTVTDARAEGSGHPMIVKAYRAVRDGAGKHIQAALPQVGDLAEKYAA